MNNQILEVVDSVSMEKGVDKSIIFEALEEAIASATKKLLGESSEIKVNIDKTTGEYVTFRYWQLSPSEDEDEGIELLPEDISDYETVDDLARKQIENIDFGRISAQAAKQVIIQKVREAERSKITQKYESLVGQVISGQVKRINRDFFAARDRRRSQCSNP